MTGWPYPKRRVTHLQTTRWTGALSVLLAATLILVDVVVRTLGRNGRRRREPELLLSANSEIAETIARLPPQGTRIVLQTIALHAQTLTGAERAAAGISGDVTHPFEIWAHVGLTPGEAPKSPPMPVQEEPDLLAVPIRLRGHVVGRLCLDHKHGGGNFTFEDQHIAEMLAARASSALEAARMHDAQGQAFGWLQSVVDQMAEGVLVVDSQGRVTLQNSQLQSFIDVPPPDGSPFASSLAIDLRLPSGEPLPPDELPLTRALVDREVTVARELLSRHADQRVVPLLVSAAPVLMSDGSVAGAVLLCQDVSTVGELQRLREEWASIVAHDLRQPISVIALRSSLLLRTALSSEQRDCVEQIAKSVHGLGRMVSDLMDASLLESDRLRVTLGRLDLGQLVQEVVRRTAAAARTRLSIHPDPRLRVKGDAERLEQVITNLVSNAVKYAAPDTEILVDVGVDAGQAHLRVTNVGDGIPADELPFIFNRFARAHNAEVRGVKGLGLGLYIAKGLVAAHHGRIWAESVPGDRTTFHVTLPPDDPPCVGEPLALPAPLFVKEPS